MSNLMEGSIPDVAIIGGGYVGLPLAVQAAANGHTVFVIERDGDLISHINARHSPFANDPWLASELAAIPKDRLYATRQLNALSLVKTIIVCVPTPAVGGVPDLTFVLDAVRTVATHLQRGQLIVLESTVNPGVTQGQVLPILSAQTFEVGRDFFLAHCPERIDPGNPHLHIGNINRILGGVTPACTAKALAFYQGIVGAFILPMSSVKAAELTKSYENTHRNGLITLINYLAIYCDANGLDVLEILAGMQTKVDQFGLQFGRPGLGPGGHCIPVDPRYIVRDSRALGLDTGVLDAMLLLNERMPGYALRQWQQVALAHNEEFLGLRVALLGLAYKPRVGDARESSAVELAKLLVQEADYLTVHDPYVDMTRVRIVGAIKTSNLDLALSSSDAIVIGTAHPEYLQLDWSQLRAKGIRFVFDGWDCLEPDQVKGAGLIYCGIGRR
jgi:UDP-N-acetyl-D-glucosamine dehydrogenase